MQKVEKLIQSGDIGPPADILSQNCQKRAIRPRNVHAPKSRSDSSLQEHNIQSDFPLKRKILHLIGEGGTFTDCKTFINPESIFSWIMKPKREVRGRVRVDSCLILKVEENWFSFDIECLKSWFCFYSEAMEVEKVLAKGTITAALSEMKTAAKMIKCEFLCQI